jgi:hypothetical protein
MAVTILLPTFKATATPAPPLALSTPDAAAFAHARQHALLGTVGRRAFQYLTRIEERSWSDYLKRIRPRGASAEAKARSLTLVSEEELVQPSAERQAKIAALQPVLDYLERSDMSIKIGRMGRAWAGFLDGAAVLVSEEAIDIWTAEELQAIVAHELAHEYFSAEYGAARRDRHYDTVKEIELRCDAISIITMRTLDLHPEALLSGVSKVTRFNERRGFRNFQTLTPSLEERTSFGRAMLELTGEPRRQ